MTQAVMQTSFAGGEFAPALYARVDLEKFHIGAALLENFFVDYRGGASNRAGTEWCAEVKRVAGAKRLIPFIVAQERAYALEFGNQYIRFFSDGAQVLEGNKIITGVSQASPAVVTSVAHGYTTGQEVYIAAVGGMPLLNGRNFVVLVLGANTFSIPADTTAYPAYTTGGTAARIYEVAAPYTAADLSALKYTQSADVLTLTHNSYPPYDLTRVTASTFSLAATQVGPKVLPPTITTGAANSAQDANYGYVVTAVSVDGKEESAASFPYVQHAAGYLNNAEVANHITWTSSPSQTSAYRIYRWGPVRNNQPIPTVFGLVGETQGLSFSDNKSAPDFTKTPPSFRDPFAPGQIQYIQVATGGAGYTSTGYYVPLIITDPTGTGASGYAVVSPVTSNVVGVVLVSGGIGYTAPVVTDGAGSATYSVDFDAGIAPYPATASYFQQRRVYGGIAGYPERMIFSQIANYVNFDVSPVVLDSDGITISLASREVNAIRSMVPTSTGLVTFTSGGASLVGGGGTNTAVTPNNIINSPQASTGANDLPPLLVNYDILFVQSKGSVVRDLAFNLQIQSYYGSDRSALASHLFSGFTLVDWCWVEEPFKLVHAVRSDGALLTLSYVPEQEVYGWSHHLTQGRWKSAISIPEGNENVPYYIIERFIGGVWIQYVERLASRGWNIVADAWFVDCGLRLPAAYPEATVTPGAATGTAVVFTADSAVFSSGDVGKDLWVGGGQARVVGYTDSTHLTADIIRPITQLMPYAVSVPYPQAPGEWQLIMPVLRIGGLWHLVGQTVVGLADGLTVTPRVVDGQGGVNLDNPASKIVIGLAYEAKLQTLYLAADNFPQGRMKNTPYATFRVERSLGFLAGTTFTNATFVKSPAVSYSPFPQLLSEDCQHQMMGSWTKGAQICVKQTEPLPVTILGIIPEVQSGDTGN